ncbi:MAG: hypothetical protein HRT36_04070 [Alphaproteobacteria bacterium]|nr:hypothetical protein [Alphaproteobacteria bacterium]
MISTVQTPDLTIVPQRGIVLCSGREAGAFLDGLISCALPETGAMHYGFLLNAQGRIVHDFFIAAYDAEHYLIDCAANETQSLAQELVAQCLDSAVKITRPQSLSVQTSVDEPKIENGWSIPDPRHVAMGWRCILEGEIPQHDPSYTHRRLVLGLPEGHKDLPRNKALPLEYGLENLATIDFGKGCFLGQEVCTRMHRRQTSKFTVLALNASKALNAGDILSTDDHENTGQILSTYGHTVFARIYKLRAENSILRSQTHPNAALTPLPQPWRAPIRP